MFTVTFQCGELRVTATHDGTKNIYATFEPDGTIGLEFQPIEEINIDVSNALPEDGAWVVQIPEADPDLAPYTFETKDGDIDLMRVDAMGEESAGLTIGGYAPGGGESITILHNATEGPVTMTGSPEPDGRAAYFIPGVMHTIDRLAAMVDLEAFSTMANGQCYRWDVTRRDRARKTAAALLTELLAAPEWNWPRFQMHTPQSRYVTEVVRAILAHGAP